MAPSPPKERKVFLHLETIINADPETIPKDFLQLSSRDFTKNHSGEM